MRHIPFYPVKIKPTSPGGALKDTLFSAEIHLAMDVIVFGLIAGLAHHLCVQYPNQSKLSTILYVYALWNAIFAIVKLFIDQPSTHRLELIIWLLPYLFVFNLFYVTILFKNN
jgi:hypothetical protein